MRVTKLEALILAIFAVCLIVPFLIQAKDPSDFKQFQRALVPVAGAVVCGAAIYWLRSKAPTSERRGFPVIQKRTDRGGFTLVELMISLAMMMVLMYAVNYIFSSVGKATSTGQAISRINRDVQAAQAVMYGDFANIALDGPYLLIHSERQAAFRTKTERLGDHDYDPNTSPTPANIDNEIRTYSTGTDGTDDATYQRPILGQRNFRLDRISFFSRGACPRQTGNDGQYIADQSGSEALVWYGHLKQPDTSGALNAHKPPGTDAVNGTSPCLNDVTNPYNFYATQWVLGRVVTLLIPETPKPTGSSGPVIGVWDNSSPPVSQVYIQRSAAAAVTSLAPIDQGSVSSVGTYQVQWARYDVAGTSFSQFKTIMNNALSTSPALSWWDGAHINYRYQANPVPTRPMTSEGAARTVPNFLQGCTNFVVEFAGDFVHQNVTTGAVDNWYGDPTPTPSIPKTDGKIDYILVTNPDGTKSQNILWFGFPRSTTSQNSISLANGDVVPLRDFLAVIPGAVTKFERVIPTIKANYATAAGVAVGAAYVCAWGSPDTVNEPKPTMIRISFTMDDPNGSLNDPPNYEYVFKIQ